MIEMPQGVVKAAQDAVLLLSAVLHAQFDEGHKSANTRLVEEILRESATSDLIAGLVSIALTVVVKQAESANRLALFEHVLTSRILGVGKEDEPLDPITPFDVLAEIGLSLARSAAAAAAGDGT